MIVLGKTDIFFVYIIFVYNLKNIHAPSPQKNKYVKKAEHCSLNI